MIVANNCTNTRGELSGLKAFKDSTRLSAGVPVPKLFAVQFTMVAKDKSITPKQADPCDLVYYFSLYKAMKRDKGNPRDSSFLLPN